MSARVQPVVMRPVFREKVWGGRNLERLLGKALPAGKRIGESWECADLEEGRTTVAAGPLAGRTLGELVREWGKALLGNAGTAEGRFPLLIKFLDAEDKLSVQVHPDAATAARMGAGVRAKEEAWYVIEAREGSFVYLGLREGVGREEFAAALATGDVESLLRRVAVKSGQSFHVPPGTVHALGPGVVVAEVETPSDTTFRLYDWGRQRPAGDAGMHVEQGLASIHFAAASADAGSKRSHVGGLFTTVTRLVACEAFVVEKVRFVEGMEMEIPYAEPVVWVVLEGRGTVAHGREELSFSRGDTVLLPATLKDARVRTETDCVWLEVTVPVRSDLAEFPRPDRARLRAGDGTAALPTEIRISARRKKDK